MAILRSKLHDFVMVAFVLALRVEEREQNVYLKECQKTQKQPGNYVNEFPILYGICFKNLFKNFIKDLF